jgi:ABC-type cobalamin/Fe3+-siderophores transport system ATPase subunit
MSTSPQKGEHIYDFLKVTHGALEASYCDRVIFIKDGELFNEIHRSHSQQLSQLVKIWNRDFQLVHLPTGVKENE